MFDFGILRVGPFHGACWWVTVKASPRPYNLLCKPDGEPLYDFEPPFTFETDEDRAYREVVSASAL